MFSPGIYNPQRSSYVGSSLGEFMQVLPMVQERFDQSREMFDSIDAFVDNVDHLEGDRELVSTALSPYREAIEDARRTGDYRSLYGEAGKLSKKVLNDKALKTAQMSYNNAMKQREMEAQLGTEALSFSDPTKHTSVRYNENGDPIYEVYTPRVEQRKDYDKRMVDVYNILKPDGYTDGLREYSAGDIQGFLETGSFKGLTGQKIKKYLDSAYERYISSPEGVQDFERLTKIEGMNEIDAVKDIESRLLKVGMGMEHGDYSVSYMKNPAYESARAAKSAADEMYGTRDYPGASEHSTFESVFGQRPLEVKDGKLVGSYNFSQAYKENKGKLDAITMGISPIAPFNHVTNIVGSALWTAYEGITGKTSEVNLNPVQQVTLENMKQRINPDNPQAVSMEQLAEYVNTQAKNPIPFPPVQPLNPIQIKEYKDRGLTQKVDEPKEFNTAMFNYRTFNVNGRHVTMPELRKSLLADAVESTVTGVFADDNPFGFPGGGLHVNFRLKNGKDIPLYMNFSDELDNRTPLQLKNIIQEAENYNQIAGTSLKPRKLGGMEVVAATSPTTIKLYDTKNMDAPMLVADLTSQDFANFMSNQIAVGVSDFAQIKASYLLKLSNEKR